MITLIFHLLSSYSWLSVVSPIINLYIFELGKVIFLALYWIHEIFWCLYKLLVLHWFVRFKFIIYWLLLLKLRIEVVGLMWLIWWDKLFWLLGHHFLFKFKHSLWSLQDTRLTAIHPRDIIGVVNWSIIPAFGGIIRPWDNIGNNFQFLEYWISRWINIDGLFLF